jgi:O-antigen ligase
LNTKTRLIGFLKTVSVLSIPVLLWAIRQFFIISPIDLAIIDSNTADLATWQIFGQYRAFGFFSGPFHMGLFAGFIFWIGIGFYAESRRKVWLVMALVSVIACLATLTRSSLMALLVSVPLVLIYMLKEYRFRIIAITTALLVILLSSVLLIAANVEAVNSLVQSVSSLEKMADDSRFEGRFDGYREGLHAVFENPFGVGMGSAADALGYQFEGSGHQHVTSHNILLRIALETGWIGLCLFLAILWQLARAVKRLKVRRDYWLAATAGGWILILLITGVTGSSINAYPINLLFWLVGGGIVSYSLTPIEGGKNVR